MPIAALFIAAVLTAAGGPAADLVIEHARIFSDGLPAFAEFAAVKDGRFIYVGEHDDQYIHPDTVRIDAHNAVVLPGLIDSHVHMLSGGQQLTRLNLRDATDKHDFINRIERWADILPSGKWILGGRWSVESWTNIEQPTKAWVDDASGGRPLFLSRMDGHSALANSVALKLAGITKDGPRDPVGGVIDRDPVTNEPTGILREGAMGLVARHIPANSDADLKDALRRAMHHATQYGITAVSDIPGTYDLPIYEQFARSDRLTVRFFLYLNAGDWSEAARDVLSDFTPIPYWLQVNGFKAYLDGSLGSRTAMMRERFLNNEPGREDWRGIWLDGVADGRFARNINVAAESGMQPIVHAIGDEANHLLVDTLHGAFENPRAARMRSEHAQHLLPEDIARFGELGLIASMQPFHKADDGRYAEDYIGPERARSSYAYKSLLDAGAVVAFGSDWPVVTLNPWLGIEAAVTGRTLDGKDWQTQENITVAEAIRCYTSRAAYAAKAEREIGSILPGYRADFIILNISPFGADVDFAAIEPTHVYIEGKRVK